MKAHIATKISLIFILALILLAVPLIASADTTDFDCSVVTEIPQPECEALVALYNNTDGDHWINNANWLVTTTPSNWYGVTVEKNHVIRLNLGWNRLDGTIPPEVGNFTNLSTLYLDYNQLNGNIPPELGDLFSLVELALQDNHLSGSIPAELGNLTKLFNLNLSFNDLTGNIPAELGGLSKLDFLRISNTQISGTIPGELGDLDNLRYLILSSNQLEDVIPPELGNLSSLELLILSSNQLSGSLPPELGSLSNLDVLHLQSNQLDGSIPLSFIKLSELDYFFFYDTNLCEPSTPEYIAWKDTVFNYIGTGMICALEVTISIQPDGHPKFVSCTNDKTIIEVAIITDENFDALSVDHTTVTFEGASEAHIDKKTQLPVRHEEDINGDGDMDLIFHFRFGDTTLTCDSTEGTLFGETYEDILIEGTDSIIMKE